MNPKVWKPSAADRVEASARAVELVRVAADCLNRAAACLKSYVEPEIVRGLQNAMTAWFEVAWHEQKSARANLEWAQKHPADPETAKEQA